MDIRGIRRFFPDGEGAGGCDLSDLGRLRKLRTPDWRRRSAYNRNAIVGELKAHQDQYLAQVETFMREGKGVYDMFPQSAEKLDAYLEWMNKAGYYVDDMFYMTDKLSGPQAFNMAKAQHGGRAEEPMVLCICR